MLLIIYSKKSASIQPKTSPPKFGPKMAHVAKLPMQIRAMWGPEIVERQAVEPEAAACRTISSATEDQGGCFRSSLEKSEGEAAFAALILPSSTKTEVATGKGFTRRFQLPHG